MFGFSVLFENIGYAILSDRYAEPCRHDLAPGTKYMYLVLLNRYDKPFDALSKYVSGM